ncbi:Ubiquitin carboxyl-terminal hydrolase MINDY-1 [Zea mays]|uniref:Ubiquitin carboxyl-terminal hydrolase MINDY-1 n=1 Tax=Zea mays TaxID=4577 RepID=A0A3L6EQZ5_MAIZE|nr:Ubiquitin carboxyl-terminal hydrolase MINDY-1 [Zea mays]
MSSDPSPHLPSPVAPPGAAEADPHHLPQPAEPHEVMHRTRAVDFLGRRTPIVYQNDNGPCPLLAICNVLLLKNVISLNPDAGEVSQQKLLSLVAERLIDPNIAGQDKDEEYVCNREQNIADAIDLLPRLATGIDVNVMFRKIDDFEFTRERAIFDLLDIPLYHGWIVDPQDTETATAIGSKSYNALASGLAEFKSGKPTEENKYVEEETVDFAAATTAALKIPSPSVSRGRSFDEHTLSNSSTVPHKRRGDLEEEEELMRVLNLSKAKSGDVEVSFDTSHSHSSSNIETPQNESFQSEALELVVATKKEEYGNHATSDHVSMLSVTNVAINGSEVVPEESQENLISKEPEDNGIKNLDIPIQFSETTPYPSHESFASSDHQPAIPTLVEDDKETCKEQFDVQIHGQSNDTDVACDSSVTTCEAVPDHATTELDVKSDSLDNSQSLPSSIQECEPIYQGEEHILGTTNMVYENQEPVYEGEVVLAEQADKIGESSSSGDDKATEHQWELIDNFLRTTANQLTVYGLFCLQEGLNESELCVFFRNNHFNTMFKYNGSLYLLATDQGFISQTDLVWQRLDEVNGDGVFLTSNFTPFNAETPRNDSWNEQQAMTSTADYLAQFDNSTSGNSDLELAIALQQQEFERQPQRFQAPPQQQQQQQQQPPPHTQYQTQSGRPGLVVGPRRSNAPPPSRSESKKERCIVM